MSMSSRLPPGTMSMNALACTPCEPTTSSRSLNTAELWFVGSASLWNGNSVAVSLWFGPPVSNMWFPPAFIWFTLRESTPA